jgi:hypothetical protein
MKLKKWAVRLTAVSAVFVVLILIAFQCSKKPDTKIDQIMNAERGFQFPRGFPPDPGEAGKKTLEGIDSDHDGLRDDLQRWIYARFPNEPKKRAALKQMAIVFGKELMINHDRKELIEAHNRSEKAIVCLRHIFGSLSGEMGIVRAKVLNTYERSKRHLEINRWYDGMGFESRILPAESTCEY